MRDIITGLTIGIARLLRLRSKQSEAMRESEDLDTKKATMWLAIHGYPCKADAICRACREGEIEATKKPNPKGGPHHWMMSESALQEYFKTFLLENQPHSSRQEPYATLDWIQAYIADRGFPPSLRDICKGHSISSTSLASAYLRKLEELGEITIAKNTARGIRIQGH